MVLASDKAHSQNIRFIRGINFSVFFPKNRKESFLRWLGAAFPAPLCVPLVCPASGRCPRHLSAMLGGMDAAPYSRYRRRPAPPAEAELQEESRNGSGPCAGFMWETDRADTGSERIRQRSGRNSSFDHAFPGVFPYARRVPFREHPPGQTRRALYEDMAYYRLFVRSWKGTR